MRKFSIKNASGVILGLYDHDLFAHDPSGLGLNIDNDINAINGNFYNDSSKYSLDDISFKLICGAKSRAPYNNFRYFVNHLKGGGLTLIYDTPELGTLYRDVVIKSISKTEMNDKGVLDETVIFEPLSFWYVIKEFEGRATVAGNTPLEIDLSDSISLVDHSFRCEMVIENDTGNTITPVNGYFKWTYPSDERHSGSDSYLLSLQSGYKLIVSDMEGFLTAEVVSPTGVSTNARLAQADSANHINLKNTVSTLVMVTAGAFKFTVRVKQEFMII